MKRERFTFSSNGLDAEVYETEKQREIGETKMVNKRQGKRKRWGSF